MVHTTKHVRVYMVHTTKHVACVCEWAKETDSARRDLQAKRTEESPLVARFGSEEQQADISVSVRGANTLKLTFLQIKDVTEFGDVVEAASLFVPPGAKLISSTSRTEAQLNNAGGGTRVRSTRA